jgi:hypothetical protein
MKTTLNCFVCVLTLSLQSNAANPGDFPSTEKNKLVDKQVVTLAKSVDYTTRMKIVGIIVQTDEETFSGKRLKLIAQKTFTEGFGAAFISTTEDEKLNNKVFELLSLRKKMADRMLTGEASVEQKRVGSFSLHVANRSFGEITYAPNAGARFDTQINQHSGVATIAYESEFEPDNPEQAVDMFNRVMNTFIPLAKELTCSSIWIRMKTHKEPNSLPINNSYLAGNNIMGVVWGEGRGWCQIMLLGPTSNNETSLTVNE